MAGSGRSRADENREIRKEALREILKNKGLVQNVLEIAEKLEDLDNDLDALKIQRLKSAADMKLKLVAKYLPDIKAVELTGEDGEPIKASVAVSFIGADVDDNGTDR